MSRCRSCDAQIFWAKTATGKAIPLDSMPNPTGNVTLAGAATVHAASDVIPEGVTRYISHFVTCPQSKEWRK